MHEVENRPPAARRRSDQHRSAPREDSGNVSARRKLDYCRALLAEMDPQHPPHTAQAREFSWQYRALRERVAVYSACLEAAPDRARASQRALEKAQFAIDLSLQYFHDVLKPTGDAEE